MFYIKIITAYPEMFPGALAFSLIGKALNEKKFSLETINLHDFGFDNRKGIDDEPFGGGPGMIIRPDVVERALLSINSKHSQKIIFFSVIIASISFHFLIKITEKI